MSDVEKVLKMRIDELERQGYYFRVLRFLAEVNKIINIKSCFSLSDTELEKIALGISEIMCDEEADAEWSHD